MRTIEITTTQKVAIDYLMAPLRDRILAFLLDFLVLFGYSWLMSLIFGLFASGDPILAMLIFLPVTFYALLTETLMAGQTVGKKVMRIRVVKLNGRAPSIGDYMLRWLFRIVEIWWCFGSVAAVLISASSKNQRLGDLLANTTVIRQRTEGDLSLRHLLSLHGESTYEPTYPEVKRYSEADMLLVKRTLDRARQYPNDTHMDIVDDLVDKIQEQLGIRMEGSNKLLFLQTLVRDYVVMTR